MNGPDWAGCGKTVAQLIAELQTFEDPQMQVRLSVDGGSTSVPISLVVRCNGKYAVLKNAQDVPDVIRHHPDMR